VLAEELVLVEHLLEDADETLLAREREQTTLATTAG
jgi:hypothetical protein